MLARRRRPGFTLLEVLLASAIAVLLLAGLYVAFDLILTRTDAAREEAARADLARAIVNRMALDLSASLGPMPPKSGGGLPSTTTTTTTTTTTPSTSTGTTGGTITTSGSATGGTTGTSGATGGSTTGGTSGSSSSSSSASSSSGSAVSDSASADAEAPLAADVPFQGGVIGTDTQVTLFASRLPPGSADPTAVTPSDLRRVTYYLGSGGGLCRQDRPWVTADGVRNSADADRSTEATDLIAPEVAALTFEYFDGSGWTTSWDGSLPAADGTSVTGPPRAIRVTLTLAYAEADGTPVERTVQHVFPVRAANGLLTAPAPVTDDSTTTSETTTTTGGM